MRKAIKKCFYCQRSVWLCLHFESFVFLKVAVFVIIISFQTARAYYYTSYIHITPISATDNQADNIISTSDSVQLHITHSIMPIFAATNHNLCISKPQLDVEKVRNDF